GQFRDLAEADAHPAGAFHGPRRCVRNLRLHFLQHVLERFLSQLRRVSEDLAQLLNLFLGRPFFFRNGRGLCLCVHGWYSFQSVQRRLSDEYVGLTIPTQSDDGVGNTFVSPTWLALAPVPTPAKANDYLALAVLSSFARLIRYARIAVASFCSSTAL